MKVDTEQEDICEKNQDIDGKEEEEKGHEAEWINARKEFMIMTMLIVTSEEN